MAVVTSVAAVDTTIRNLDEQAYREARARAVLEGRTIGDVVNEALRSYLKRTVPKGKRGLAELRPELFGEGNQRLSCEIDDIVYGSFA